MQMTLWTRIRNIVQNVPAKIGHHMPTSPMEIRPQCDTLPLMVGRYGAIPTEDKGFTSTNIFTNDTKRAMRVYHARFMHQRTRPTMGKPHLYKTESGVWHVCSFGLEWYNTNLIRAHSAAAKLNLTGKL